MSQRVRGAKLPHRLAPLSGCSRRSAQPWKPRRGSGDRGCSLVVLFREERTSQAQQVDRVREHAHDFGAASELLSFCMTRRPMAHAMGWSCAAGPSPIPTPRTDHTPQPARHSRNQPAPSDRNDPELLLSANHRSNTGQRPHLHRRTRHTPRRPHQSPHQLGRHHTTTRHPHRNRTPPRPTECHSAMTADRRNLPPST